VMSTVHRLASRSRASRVKVPLPYRSTADRGVPAILIEYITKSH